MASLRIIGPPGDTGRAARRMKPVGKLRPGLPDVVTAGVPGVRKSVQVTGPFPQAGRAQALGSAAGEEPGWLNSRTGGPGAVGACGRRVVRQDHCPHRQTWRGARCASRRCGCPATGPAAAGRAPDQGRVRTVLRKSRQRKKCRDRERAIKGTGHISEETAPGQGAWAPYGRHAPARRTDGHPDETTRAMASVAANGSVTRPRRWGWYPPRDRMPSACGTAGAVSWCLRQPFAAPARADLCRGCRCRWRMAVCSACARAGPVPFLPGKAAPGALSGMVRGCCRGRL